MTSDGPARGAPPLSAGARLGARIRLGVPFYLGLGAPAARREFPECRVRAAAGYSPELVRELLALYLALRRPSADPRLGGPARAGTLGAINFRCARIVPADSQTAFFFKEFPRIHWLHDVERSLRCSRVDRAWRAGHLLPRLGVATPPPVGTAWARVNGRPVEYLATEWLDDAVPFPGVVTAAPGPDRASLLAQFASEMRRWHDLGIYLRDLVKNVLVTSTLTQRQCWLTDLDGLHPARRPTRGRVLRQMRQLADRVGPLSPDEAQLICDTYLAGERQVFAGTLLQALLPEAGGPSQPES